MNCIYLNDIRYTFARVPFCATNPHSARTYLLNDRKRHGGSEMALLICSENFVTLQDNVVRTAHFCEGEISRKTKTLKTHQRKRMCLTVVCFMESGVIV